MKVRVPGTGAWRTFKLSAPSTIDDLDRTSLHSLRLSVLSLLDELGLKLPLAVDVRSKARSPLNAEENRGTTGL